jgi:putative membrane protein
MTEPSSKPKDSSDGSFFERPVSRLATYYFLGSLLALPAFPIVLLVHLCKYWTLQYTFDDEGIAMKWGVLWRREIHLTYRRIQDIHLTRNVVQRWMGLANVSVQTAGASAAPEMVIEGAPDPDGLRDALYARMRGASSVTVPARSPAGAVSPASDPAAGEAIALLEEIRDLLKERQA